MFKEIYILKKKDFKQHQIVFRPNSCLIWRNTQLVYYFLTIKRKSWRTTFRCFWSQHNTSSTKHSVNAIVHVIGFTNAYCQGTKLSYENFIKLRFLHIKRVIRIISQSHHGTQVLYIIIYFIFSVFFMANTE